MKVRVLSLSFFEVMDVTGAIQSRILLISDLDLTFPFHIFFDHRVDIESRPRIIFSYIGCVTPAHITYRQTFVATVATQTLFCGRHK